MKKIFYAAVLGVSVSLAAPQAFADHAASPATAAHAAGDLSGATIFIIRHAEKTGIGQGLSPAGAIRAEAYAAYFENLTLDGRKIRIDSLVASTDTEKSARPRLTLEPLSGATGMPIIQPCSSGDVDGLVTWLKAQPAGETFLISWHHSKIERILTALGVSHKALLPDGRWPSDFFDWIIALRFDQAGHLLPGGAKLLHEPMSVDNVVWSAMGHPTIHPAQAPAPPAESQP